MRSIFAIILIFIVFSCGRNPSIKDDYNKLLDAEIAKRFELLQAENPGVNIQDVKTVHEDITKLILLSKDAENSTNVLNKVNAYFEQAAHSYNVPNEGFVILAKTMSLQSIEATIKTNELNLLDKIIFAQTSLSKDSVMMNSVY